MTLLARVLALGIPAIAFFLMTVVGMDLGPDDFHKIKRSPRSFFVGFIGQIILPFTAICISRAVLLSPGILFGMLLIAAAPGGGISNYYNYLARANVALSVAWTTLSCLAAGITMPLLLKSFQFFVHSGAAFSVPLPVLLTQSFLMLVVPVVLGICLRRWSPGFVKNHSVALRKLSFLGLGGLITFIIYQSRDSFLAQVGPIMMASGALISLSFGGGYLLATLFQLDSRDRFTLAVEYAVRNVAIATAVAVSVLKRTEFAVFGTAYFLTEIPIILIAVAIYRSRPLREMEASQTGQ